MSKRIEQLRSFYGCDTDAVKYGADNTARDIAMLLEHLRLAEAVVEAARNIGMNWKTGAPYGGDALDGALRAYDRNREKESEG